MQKEGTNCYKLNNPLFSILRSILVNNIVKIEKLDIKATEGEYIC